MHKKGAYDTAPFLYFHLSLIKIIFLLLLFSCLYCYNTFNLFLGGTMKKRRFIYAILLTITPMLAGCKSTPIDDGTNNFATTINVAKPAITDDGTNASINQVIMNNLPKKSLTSTPTTSNTTSVAKTNSPTPSSSKGSSKTTPKAPVNTYVPPSVVTPQNNTLSFYYPIANPGNYTVSNGGLDFTVSGNTPVYISSPGVVIFAGKKESFGNAVFVYNDNNYITIYYQLTSINVKKGDYLSSFSTPIGSATSQFHFEIRQKTDTNITVINAEKILQPRSTLGKNLS